MWFATIIFFILWLVSLRMFLPAAVVYTFFTAMLAMGAAAIAEARAERRGRH